jgi:hypothetical protein
MQVVLLFLGKYEPHIYLVLALFSLLVFRWLWRAWKEWREAYFGLERELAMRRLAQAVVWCVLVLILACSELVVGSFIVPGLPASALATTPTLDLLGTPTLQVINGTPVTPVATIVVAATAPGSEGCVPGKLEITFPKPGDSLNGKIEILGTVNVPDFGFYKYEFAPAGSELWATISADRKTKINESLGSWLTSVLTPGDYRLRLVVTDTQGKTLPPCIIPVRIIGQ